MTKDDSAQREDGSELGDAPVPWDNQGSTDHASGASEAEEESPLEALEESRKFFKESNILNFLGGGAPGHVNADEMAENGLEDVDRDATHEDGHEWEPHEILEDW